MAGRIGIDDVAPVVSGGRYPAKAVVGEVVPVRATVWREGHDAVSATLVVRFHGTEYPQLAEGPGQDRPARSASASFFRRLPSPLSPIRFASHCSPGGTRLQFCVSSEPRPVLSASPICWRARCLAPWAAHSRWSCSSSCTNCFGSKCERRDDLPGLTTSWHSFPRRSVLALIAVGMGLGFAGSFVSIRRFGEAKA